jgi:hAT family C-terminal dimerisation region
MSEQMKLFCKRAAENSSIKFSSEYDKPAMIATALDPRHKSLSFLSAAEGGKCLDALNSAYISLGIEQGEQPEMDNSNIRGKKKVKVNHPDIFTDFTANILDTFSPSKTTAIKSEFDRYKDHPELERDGDPLDWWRLNATRYPKLAVLARRYLAIPASSASSERLFSRLKLTATAARQGLSPDTLCMLLFVCCHQRK